MSNASLICDLARQFYDLGWVTGTGGGICIRENDRVLIAPSGVQKERMTPDQMFTFSVDGKLLDRPGDPELRPSECTALFMAAIRHRDAGAVIHSHSMNAMLASLLFDSEFVISELEMIKGIEGMSYHDRLVVPKSQIERDALGDVIGKPPARITSLIRRALDRSVQPFLVKFEKLPGIAAQIWEFFLKRYHAGLFPAERARVARRWV